MRFQDPDISLLCLASFALQTSRLSTGLYYKVVEQPSTYGDARADCEADGAHVATFATQEEFEHIMEIASKMNVTFMVLNNYWFP